MYICIHEYLWFQLNQLLTKGEVNKARAVYAFNKSLYVERHCTSLVPNPTRNMSTYPYPEAEHLECDTGLDHDRLRVLLDELSRTREDDDFGEGEGGVKNPTKIRRMSRLGHMDKGSRRPSRADKKRPDIAKSLEKGSDMCEKSRGLDGIQQGDIPGRDLSIGPCHETIRETDRQILAIDLQPANTIKELELLPEVE